MKKLLLLLPLLLLTLGFSPSAKADDHRHGRGDRGRVNRNYHRGDNRHRGFEQRSYQGRSRYYRDGRYYYRGRDGYYPYGHRSGGPGVIINF